MANLTFYIDKNNADRDGFSPIKANITIDYKNVTKTVGKVKLRHWNKKRQRVSPPRPNEDDNGFEKINDTLDKLKTESQAYFRDCLSQNIQVTPELVKNFFKGKKLSFEAPAKIDLWQAYDEYLKFGEVERAANTIRNRKTIQKYLKTFESEAGYEMNFDTINLSFFDILKEYVLVTRGHDYNYLSAITDKFKAFMSWCLTREYHNNIIYQKFSAPEKEGSVVHLTFDELQILINFNFETSKLFISTEKYTSSSLQKYTILINKGAVLL